MPKSPPSAAKAHVDRDPTALRRLDHFISDLLLARAHLKNGLVDEELGDALPDLTTFLEHAEKTLPKHARERARRLRNLDAADPAANKPIDSKNHKAVVLRATPRDFFSVMSEVERRSGKLPRVLAVAPEGAGDDEEDFGGGPAELPLTLSVGEAVQLQSDQGPYNVLITDLVDPLSFEGSLVVGYGVRLWTASEIAGLGVPLPAGFSELLEDGEVALSQYRDVIRPGTVLGKVRLVPSWWSDPEAAEGKELEFNRFFDYRRLQLHPLEFGLQTEPWRALAWLRRRVATTAQGAPWRTFDFVVDRLYHKFIDFFLSFRAGVATDGGLVELTTIVERDWMLLAPLSVLKTVKYSENDKGGTVALWIETRDEAEQMLGPSAHSDLPGLPSDLYLMKPSTGEGHLDRMRFAVALPMVMWISPCCPGETDILHFKAHMVALQEPLGSGENTGKRLGGKMRTGHTVLWDTRNATSEVIEAGKMPAGV